MRITICPVGLGSYWGYPASKDEESKKADPGLQVAHPDSSRIFHICNAPYQESLQECNKRPSPKEGHIHLEMENQLIISTGYNFLPLFQDLA
jgi:hypothetical protein